MRTRITGRPFSPLLLVFVLFFTVAIPSANATPLTPYEAVYKSTWNRMSLGSDVHYRLSHSGDDLYEMTTKASALLTSIEEKARFRMVNHRPQPLYYHKQRSRFGRKHVESVTFDWQTTQAHYQTRKQSGKLDVPVNILDRLSLQLALSCQLPGKTIGDAITFNVFDRKRIKAYRFTISADQQLTVPAGKFETLKLLRDHNSDAQRTTTLWLAAKHNYLLIKMHQRDNKDDTTLELKSIDHLPAQRRCDLRGDAKTP